MRETAAEEVNHLLNTDTTRWKQCSSHQLLQARWRYKMCTVPAYLPACLQSNECTPSLLLHTCLLGHLHHSPSSLPAAWSPHLWHQAPQVGRQLSGK
jgi:hypothetical protein